MTVEYIPRPQFQDPQLFNPPDRSPQRLDALNSRPKDPLIEKCIKELVKKGLFGRPYVKDDLYDLKLRNCRPNTLRSYFNTLTVFLSYLKQRGRTLSGNPHPG